MKRSEFVKQAAETYGLSGAGIGESVANMATNQLGVKWDPEEPELPARLRVHNDGTNIALLPAYECYSPKMFASVYYPVACDAYNRLQAGELVATQVATEEILKLIREKDALKDDLASLRDELARRQDAHRPADVIAKTRGGKTVHYAIGPTRDSRVEAERDLREWLDKGAS